MTIFDLMYLLISRLLHFVYHFSSLEIMVRVRKLSIYESWLLHLAVFIMEGDSCCTI